MRILRRASAPGFSRKLGLAVFGIIAGIVARPATGFPQERGVAAVTQQMAGLGVTMRVLMIGAHPDDEDTQLISWLTHGRHVETAYLSLTRGDGGQNLIGNELGEALGVIRTSELMAARRVDGARQYFTRAFDFGFSKDTADSFRHWPKDSLLRDVVRVVREFAPHVIISIFSGTPRDGHGQHQVAGILAREVFDAAGDTVRFPVREFGPAWLALKFYRGARFSPQEATLRINVGEYNPVLGRSYAEIAGESRSQHKSQGFGTLQRRGVIWDWLRRDTVRTDAPGDAKAETSIFDGIQQGITRLSEYRSRSPGSCALPKNVIANLDRSLVRVASLQHSPSAAALIPQLIEIHDLAGSISGAGEVTAQACFVANSDIRMSLSTILDRTEAALLRVAAIEMEAVVNRPAAALGDTFTVTTTIFNRGQVPVMLRGGVGGNGAMVTLAPDSSWQLKSVWSNATVDGKAVEAPGTQPKWLRRARVGDLFGPGTLPMDALRPGLETVASRYSLNIGGREIPISSPITYRYADPVRGDVQIPFAIAPGISVSLGRQVELARAGVSRSRYVNVTLRSAFSQAKDVAVRLSLPNGLVADSAVRTIRLGPNAVKTVTFRITGALAAGDHEVRATASSDANVFSTGFVPVDYEHIPPQRVYSPAEFRIRAVLVEFPKGLTVAYVRGVGDNVPATLSDLGIPVTVIDPHELPFTELSGFSAVVVGTRAYQSSHELVDNNSYLLEYVRMGGTAVVQYGQYEMSQPGVMPYPITLARPAERVTDETAIIAISDSASSLFSLPNRIRPGDFSNWIQERALYMPATFDPKYHTLMAMNDPGESPKASAVLVAPYGKGLYIYTTLSFFRQLPAGNPGATRLFVNLLAARAAR